MADITIKEAIDLADKQIEADGLSNIETLVGSLRNQGKFTGKDEVFVEQIFSRMLNDSKYTNAGTSHEHKVRKNSSYNLEQSIISVNRTQKYILFLTAGLSAITMIAAIIDASKENVVNVAPRIELKQTDQPHINSNTTPPQSNIPQTTQTKPTSPSLDSRDKKD